MGHQVALVTGGSRGIGFAIAKTLHAKGWCVAITSRQLQRSQQAAQQIGDCVLPLAYHAPSRSDWERWRSSDHAGDDINASTVVNQVVKEFGGISALVNAAGSTKDNLLVRVSHEELDDLLLTNLQGPIQMSKAAAKHMLRQKQGSIVNIGSVVGSRGNAGQVSYAASKAGLLGVTTTLAKELGSRGIRVNLVEPGYISTSMTATLDEHTKTRIRDAIPLGRFGNTQEVAEVVAFLVSEQASYVTGQCLRVDGGLIL